MSNDADVYMSYFSGLIHILKDGDEDHTELPELERRLVEAIKRSNLDYEDILIGGQNSPKQIEKRLAKLEDLPPIQTEALDRLFSSLKRSP